MCGMNIDLTSAGLISAISVALGSLTTLFATSNDMTTKAQKAALEALATTVKHLQEHVNAMNTVIIDLDKQVIDLTAENAQLRKEIADLQDQISAR